VVSRLTIRRASYRGSEPAPAQRLLTPYISSKASRITQADFVGEFSRRSSNAAFFDAEQRPPALKNGRFELANRID
jgi:hypothetical protein